MSVDAEQAAHDGLDSGVERSWERHPCFESHPFFSQPGARATRRFPQPLKQRTNLAGKDSLVFELLLNPAHQGINIVCRSDLDQSCIGGRRVLGNRQGKP